MKAETKAIENDVEIKTLIDKVKRLENKPDDKEFAIQKYETELKYIADKIQTISEKSNNLNFEYLKNKYDNSISTQSIADHYSNSMGESHNAPALQYSWDHRKP